jgi:hypothetical protein
MVYQHPIACHTNCSSTRCDIAIQPQVVAQSQLIIYLDAMLDVKGAGYQGLSINVHSGGRSP